MKEKTESVSSTKKTIVTIIIVIIAMLLVALVGFLLYIKTVFIGEDRVKQIIINDMNALESNVYFESVDLELDKKRYDVELYYNNKEYEYKIDAKEGKIIFTDFMRDLSNNDVGASLSSKNTSSSSEISLEDAIKIVLDEAKLNEKDVKFIKKQKEYDDGVALYDIEFHYEGYEYEYEVNASNGKIIDLQKESLYR